MASELDTQIAAAMGEVRRRRIFRRAVGIVRAFGHESVEERSDHMRLKGSFDMTIAGKELSIAEHSFGQFHENLTLKIRYDGRTVFEATERGMSPGDADLRRVIKTEHGFLVVDRFLASDWMNLLTARAIKREKEARKRSREAEIAAARRAKPEADRESDIQMADRFGLPVVVARFEEKKPTLLPGGDWV